MTTNQTDLSPFTVQAGWACSLGPFERLVFGQASLALIDFAIDPMLYCLFDYGAAPNCPLRFVVRLVQWAARASWSFG